MLALCSRCFQVILLVINPLKQFAMLFSGCSMSNFIAVLRSSRTAIARLFPFLPLLKKESIMTSMVNWLIDFFHIQQYRCCAQRFVASCNCNRILFAVVIAGVLMCLLYVLCCLSWGCLLFFANHPSSRAPARIIRYIHEPCLLPAAFHFGYSTYETTLHVLCESTGLCCDQFSIKCPLTSPETVADAAAQSQQILPPQQHASAGPLPTFTNQGNFSSKPCAGIPNMITLLFHPFA